MLQSDLLSTVWEISSSQTRHYVFTSRTDQRVSNEPVSSNWGLVPNSDDLPRERCRHRGFETGQGFEQCALRSNCHVHTSAKQFFKGSIVPLRNTQRIEWTYRPLRFHPGCGPATSKPSRPCIGSSIMASNSPRPELIIIRSSSLTACFAR